MLGRISAGSVIRHCVECLGEIWVARSTLKVIKRKGISKPLLTCIPCCTRMEARRLPDGRRLEIMLPEPEQIEEIEGELRRGKN